MNYIFKLTALNNKLYFLFLLKSGLQSMTTDVHNSIFAENILDQGILAIVGGHLQISNSNFTLNQGHGQGPLIKSYISTIGIHHTQITGIRNVDRTNTTITKSGFIDLLDSTLNILNCTIQGGYGQVAGLLYSTGSQITLDHSQIIGTFSNKAMLYSASDMYIYIYI